jgi:hypothetical protein
LITSSIAINLINTLILLPYLIKMALKIYPRPYLSPSFQR